MKQDLEKIPHRGLELLSVLSRLGGSARNAQIAQLMDVSEETVRRLVKGLAKLGKVERVHGASYLTGTDKAPKYSGALEQNAAEKSKIARTALQFIEDGMTIFINVGSTTTYVAEQLRDRNSLVVVTNSISVVAALADHNGNRVFMAGGEIQSAERGTFGSSTQSFAQKFSYDAVIMGVDAISAKQGFLLNHQAEANLTGVISSQSNLTIVVADQSKFNGRAPMVACRPQDIRHLVTDAAPDAALEESLLEWGVEVHVAP